MSDAMPEDEVIQMMVEEIVLASYDVLDILGTNADKDIVAASSSAIKQLLAIKAYELVTREKALTISLPDFVDALR